MAGTYLLDTNAAIALIAREAALEQIIKAADEVFVASITLGELYFGAEKSARASENKAQVDALAQAIAVLACDQETARRFGTLKQGLRMKGRPIPEHDVWIASVALQHSLTLITRDAHFKAVDGLAITSW